MVDERDQAVVESIKQDYTTARLSGRERAILDYAVKLTVAPSSMTADDVDALHAHGLSDRDVLDVILVTCLFNYNDRLADATGITSQDFQDGITARGSKQA